MPPVFAPRSDQADADLAFMDEALKMAEEALLSEEIPVGCVFVRDGNIIARGRNRTNETRNASLHAELDALSHILPPSETTSLSSRTQTLPQNLDNVTLYVTVEPCLMCAPALRQVGIRKCYYGASNDRFGGCGGVLDIAKDERLVNSKTLDAIGGYRREEAIMLLRRFYATENKHAPAPRDKSKRVVKTDIAPV